MTQGRASEAPAPRDLPYRLFGRARGVTAGAHRAVGSGGAGAFLRHASLLELPDARRIDMRASLLDPLGGMKVRRFENRARIDVFILLDLSGSMTFARDGEHDPVAELCATIAHAALRGQDRFGMIAAGPKARADLAIRATRRRGVAEEVWRALRSEPGEGSGVAGLLDSLDQLPARRSLVFVVSDFLLPSAATDALLAGLWRHDVAPIVVRSSAVERRLPAFGLVETRDLETGRRRLVLMRKSLREAWLDKSRRRRAELERIFLRHGRPAFDLVDRFDADAFADYLLSGGA
ncbi:DUF58 domain-containing protein [Hansschlegelia beijingensis]|uniref:Uncharacterized protein (DUF58 family) n=1 Tax=Hansschlegelia beijingensis TaxID=1133344 RepID=A0A7W6D0N4_9HYPH|nr:uncharacterized protein (DUF58 family) [Hansschlegelia beijingensis]